MPSILRSLLVAAFVVFAACGGEVDTLTPSITLSKTDATLLNRGGQWFLSAPLRVDTPSGTAGWMLSARIERMGSGSFIDQYQTQYDVPAGATSFEVPVATTGSYPRGIDTQLRLTVSAFTWNGGIEMRNATASAEYVFPGD